MTRTIKKSEKYTIEHLKKGKRLYGAFLTFDTGWKVYLAYRKHADIYRGGKKTISEALRDDAAAWAIDVETIMEARARGVKVIGVLVRDTGDIYITRLSDILDPAKTRVLNYSKRGGSLQRYMPLCHWKMKRGSVRV